MKSLKWSNYSEMAERSVQRKKRNKVISKRKFILSNQEQKR